MAAILQFVLTCIDKLNLANLVDAHAEYIRSRAYWNCIVAFVPPVFFGGLVLMGIIGVIGWVVYLTMPDKHGNHYERR